MSHPLEGIDERLKRADENIQNLDIEINRFLEEGGHRQVTYTDPKSIKEFNDFWSKQAIPPRFGVLISEILHHYRSALDNLIWELLRQAGHTPRNPNVIEFPILNARPPASNKLTLFDRKIEGVGNKASAVIESLQPYNAISEWEGPHHAILILHDMNRFDKHRELTVFGSRSRKTPQISFVQALGIRKDAATGREIRTILAQREVYMGMKLTALITFRQFGNNGPSGIAVTPGLMRIKTAVSDAIKMFDGFFPPR